MTPSMHPSVRSERGFTLAELMVAFVVFAIGALALALVVPAGMRRVTLGGQQTRASELASQAAERLLVTPYPDTSVTEGTHTDTSNPYSGAYYVQWVVEDDQPDSACKRITITVSRNSVSSTPLSRLVLVNPSAGS